MFHFIYLQTIDHHPSRRLTSSTVHSSKAWNKLILPIETFVVGQNTNLKNCAHDSANLHLRLGKILKINSQNPVLFQIQDILTTLVSLTGLENPRFPNIFIYPWCCFPLFGPRHAIMLSNIQFTSFLAQMPRSKVSENNAVSVLCLLVLFQIDSTYSKVLFVGPLLKRRLFSNPLLYYFRNALLADTMT